MQILKIADNTAKISRPLMIASDLHGSLYYAEKMKKAYENEGARKLVLLGDLLYHGPRNDLPKGYEPKGVIKLLNSMKNELICVRGNCDCEVDQMVLEFPILSDSSLIMVEGHTMFATHGHIFNRENLPPLKPGDILLNGHTHVPVMEKFGDIYFLNPGSLSIPKDGSAPGYLIYHDGVFEYKKLV